MSLSTLAGVYLTAGVLAAAWLVRRGRARLVEAPLVAALWPLCLPLWGPAPEQPLATKLAMRRALVQRALAELEAWLGRPGCGEAEAEAHLAALRSSGATPTALELASRRLENVRRLAALRARCQAELAELDELTRGLDTEAAVLRLDAAAARDDAIAAEAAAYLETLHLLGDDDALVLPRP